MARTPAGIPYSNPTTSQGAAVAMGAKAPNLRAATLRGIHQASLHGMTDEMLEHTLGMLHQTLSARRNELLHVGLIEDSGRRVKNQTRAEAILWVTTSLVTQYHLDTGDLTGMPILPQYRKDQVTRLFNSFKKLSSQDKRRFLQTVVAHVR
jgi:ABC-type bacteriocin/lantibiotic exporter with double-glycine peptidase domain